MVGWAKEGTISAHPIARTSTTPNFDWTVSMPDRATVADWSCLRGSYCSKCVCVCVCVCVWERERERESVCVCVHSCVWVCVCVCACVCNTCAMRVCACLCIDRGRSSLHMYTYMYMVYPFLVIVLYLSNKTTGYSITVFGVPNSSHFTEFSSGMHNTTETTYITVCTIQPTNGPPQVTVGQIGYRLCAS